jgi:plastocyanin
MFFLNPIVTSLTVSGAFWSHRELPWNSSSIGMPLFASATSSVTAPTRQVVEIAVGAAGLLAFNPASVNVMEGTVLRFNFLGLNHTLTQSVFHHPCLSNSQFDTGFRQFNPSNSTGKFIVDFEVNSSQPQWFFCAQQTPKSHCHAGMVFSLNPYGKQSDFIDNARNSRHAPVITSPPGLAYCSGMGTTPLSHMVRPSDGTVSWTMQPPNVTSISPQISNDGQRLGYWVSNLLGGLLLMFGVL